jgi:signal transduction histidine kinase
VTVRLVRRQDAIDLMVSDDGAGMPSDRNGDAPDAYIGFDVVVTDDGRIRNVYGFMDAAPAA